MAHPKPGRILLAALLCLGPALAASAQSTKRPFSDWLSPNLVAGDILWFDSEAPAPQELIFFDYFGRHTGGTRVVTLVCSDRRPSALDVRRFGRASPRCLTRLVA